MICNPKGKPPGFFNNLLDDLQKTLFLLILSVKENLSELIKYETTLFSGLLDTYDPGELMALFAGLQDYWLKDLLLCRPPLSKLTLEKPIKYQKHRIRLEGWANRKLISKGRKTKDQQTTTPKHIIFQQ